MRERKTVRSMTVGQMKDLISAIVQALPTTMSFDQAGRLIKRKGELARKTRALINDMLGINFDFSVYLEGWQNFYFETGLSPTPVDFSGVTIPEKREGFDRLLIVLEGLTLNGVMAKLKELMPTWQYYDDLDKAVTHNDRVADHTYAIWVRDRVEADEEHKNKSANALAEARIFGITLLERMIFEFKYLKETGQHLDLINVTLCAGSGYADGVPSARWVDDEFGVGGCDPDASGGALRGREVVSSAETA